MKKIWNDPVWSKVIANGLTALIAYLFFKLTNPNVAIPSNNLSSHDGMDMIMKSIFTFFESGFGLGLKYAIWVLLALIFIRNLIKIIRGIIVKRKFNQYRTQIMWGANFKWKWTKYSDDFEIQYDDIQKICPTCGHDLSFRKTDYYMTLICNSCHFESAPFYMSRSVEDYSLFILPGGQRTVFYREFNSNINAGLRQRGML
jgi:hypothetical protein